MPKKKKLKIKNKKSKIRKVQAKKTVKKGAKKKATRSSVKKTAKKQAPEISLEKIGEVTHYFPHVKAAAIMLLKDGLKVGDDIYIKGHTTDFKEKVKSIKLDHVSIDQGKKNQEIGILVNKRVRQGDSVYRV